MSDDSKQAFDFWALVELFGHQRLAGRVTEQQIGGDSFVRIDVPDDKGDVKYTRFFGAKAIYSINPMVKEDCVRLANSVDSAPVKAWELPRRKVVSAGSDDDSEDDERDY